MSRTRRINLLSGRFALVEQSKEFTLVPWRVVLESFEEIWSSHRATRWNADVAELKLPQIPDRTPVKISISLTPDLHQALAVYAAHYAKTYDRDEPIAELVRAMLGAILESDRTFVRSRGGK